MRFAALAAAAVALTAGLSAGLAGCSDSSSPDADTAKQVPSTEQFCGALQDFQADFAKADSSDLPAYVAALKAAAERLDNVGVPTDMPDDAHQGFDLTISRITGLPEAATTQDVAGLGDVSAPEQKQLDALDDFIKQECPALSGTG
jgi:hypothetical protein